MTFIEDDDTLEIVSQPINDLLDTRTFSFALVGAQCGEGDEEDAFIELDRLALAEA